MKTNKLINFHVSGGGGNNRRLKFVGVGESYRTEVFNSNQIFLQSDGTYKDCSGNEVDFRNEEDGYYVDFDGVYDTNYGTCIEKFEDLNDEEQQVCLNSSDAKFYMELEGINFPQEINED